MARKKIKLTIAEKKEFFMARLRGKSSRNCAKDLDICYGTAQKIQCEEWYLELLRGVEAYASAHLELTKRSRD